MLLVPIATEAASLISFQGEAYFIHSHVLMFVSDLLQFSGFLRYSGFLHHTIIFSNLKKKQQKLDIYVFITCVHQT
jgi:hypothetical protein